MTKKKRKVNRKAIYLLSIFFFVLLVNLFFVRVAFVRGDSMQDTLQDGDIVLFYKFRYNPEVEDIVVTRTSPDLHVRLIKRIESMEQVDGHVESVFLVGDNLEASVDSRELGDFPVEEVEGKVFFRIYPFHKIGWVD